jgi:drug/metabolite transporter (DMT)-like permease
MSHLLLALRSRRGAAERRALVVMAVLVLVWGYSWILAKMALAYCGPLELATLRTAIGTTALFPALGRVCKPVWPEHPWEALGVGVVQTSGFPAAQQLGAVRGRAGEDLDPGVHHAVLGADLRLAVVG